MRLPFASKCLRFLARGSGVSGWESKWRICGGSVGVVIVGAAGPEEKVDLRREDMRSFTVGWAALLSV